MSPRQVMEVANQASSAMQILSSEENHPKLVQANQFMELVTKVFHMGFLGFSDLAPLR